MKLVKKETMINKYPIQYNDDFDNQPSMEKLHDKLPVTIK
jgi:hypothetical protein